MSRLETQGLTRRYAGDAAPAVEELTLDVAPGEFVALLGPSGCGKTTALRMIAGLERPDAGAVRLDGRDVTRLAAERRGTVLAFQDDMLFPWLTVGDNVGFGLRMRGVAPAEIARRSEAMLARMRLPGMAGRRPAELSGGQRQRVALARALVVEPRVLLLDEPFSSLDAHLRGEMRDLVAELRRELGITTLLVTHDQEEAVAVADRIALLLDGRLRQVGPPAAFYDRPGDAEVARFFGGVNFVRGRVAGGRFACGIGSLALPPGLPEGPGLLTIRPEAVRLGPGENAREARVAARRYMGREVRLSLDLGALRLEAAMAPDRAAGIGAGDAVTLHLPPAALWVVPPQDDGSRL